MASVKVKFRPSRIEGREGSIYYQIIHQRTVRTIPTDFRLLPQFWDSASSSILIPQQPTFHSLLKKLNLKIHRDLERILSICRKFEYNNVPYSAEDIITEFHNFKAAASLASFTHDLADRLSHNGRIRTSEVYLAALNSFLQSRGGEDILLDEIDSAELQQYEGWLRGRGVVPNTISFYLRSLRAIYNRAVDESLIPDRAPFRHVYTGIDKTMKRAVSLNIMRCIASADFSGSRALSFARDMFLLSFMLRGMSFVDMAFLKKSDLRAGVLSYRRRKTGQALSIIWTPEMQAIVEKYPREESPYLLPILSGSIFDLRREYRNKASAINRNLKSIAARIGIPVPLTMYVARHTWASAARAEGFPISTISQGMGHDSESTTLIYLASIDTTAVDMANARLIKALWDDDR